MRRKLLKFIIVLAVTSLFSGCKSNQEIKNDEKSTSEILSEEGQDKTTEKSSEATTSEVEKVDYSKCALEDVTAISDNTFDCSYENVKHEFIVDLPDIYENAPLILMLHGYGGSAEAFRSDIEFEKDANANGYVVVYVTGAPSPEDKTSSAGWNSGIGVSSNNDVEFLCALVNYMCTNFSLDATRVYAIGFSNGAFMTHRLAVYANDIFAGVVSVAGMMPESIWENKPVEGAVSVFQITGEKDDVVPKNSDGSAKFSKAPAIEDVIDYYVAINGLSLSETSDIGKKSVLTKYASSDASKQVWNLSISDGCHSWPDEAIVGFNTNALILDFLEQDAHSHL